MDFFVTDKGQANKRRTLFEAGLTSFLERNRCNGGSSGLMEVFTNEKSLRR